MLLLFARISFLAALIAATLMTPVNAASVTAKDTFRQQIADSLNLSPNSQFVTLGPLRNGRVLKFQIDYVPKDGPVYIERTNDAQSFLIVFPRSRIRFLPLTIDALYACFKAPVLCGTLNTYFSKLPPLSNVLRAPFIEDVVPQANGDAIADRFTKPWAEFQMRGIELTTLTINVHEMCHGILGHLDMKFSSKFEQRKAEGEADGCMFQFMKVIESSAGLGIAAVVHRGVRTTHGQEPEDTHPPLNCRLQARVNEGLPALKDLFGPGSAALGALADNVASAFAFEPDGQCDAYKEHVEAGRKAAMSLFDQNTALKVRP